MRQILRAGLTAIAIIMGAAGMAGPPGSGVSAPAHVISLSTGNIDYCSRSEIVSVNCD